MAVRIEGTDGSWWWLDGGLLTGPAAKIALRLVSTAAESRLRIGQPVPAGFRLEATITDAHDNGACLTKAPSGGAPRARALTAKLGGRALRTVGRDDSGHWTEARPCAAPGRHGERQTA